MYIIYIHNYINNDVLIIIVGIMEKITKNNHHKSCSEVPSHGASEVRGGTGGEGDHLLHCQPQLHAVQRVGDAKLLLQLSLRQALDNGDRDGHCSMGNLFLTNYISVSPGQKMGGGLADA